MKSLREYMEETLVPPQSQKEREDKFVGILHRACQRCGMGTETGFDLMRSKGTWWHESCLVKHMQEYVPQDIDHSIPCRIHDEFTLSCGDCFAYCYLCDLKPGHCQLHDRQRDEGPVEINIHYND